MSPPTGTARDRADTILAAFIELGPEARSLAALCDRLHALGVRISLPTLKRYSSRYQWQARAAEADREEARRRQETAVGQVLSTLERHVQLARALQGAGGSALQKLLSSDGRLQQLKATDIARLLELGLKAERQALGESSDRKDIMISLANLLTSRLVAIFQDINQEPDPDRRARLFASGLDQLVGDHLSLGGST